jgi:NAD(P)-dependent dehydrogenase (short-subunit alcohol dehydrogenase family)
MPSALITGANRGLGLEFARQYLADGWQVYAACRNPASAFELRRLAEHRDDKLCILGMDVTDPASIHAAATMVAARTHLLAESSDTYPAVLLAPSPLRRIPCISQTERCGRPCRLCFAIGRAPA